MTSEGCSANPCPSEEELSVWRAFAIACISTLAGLLYFILSWRHVFPQFEWLFARIFQAFGGLFAAAEVQQTGAGGAADVKDFVTCVRSMLTIVAKIIKRIAQMAGIGVNFFSNIFKGQMPQFFKVFMTFFQILGSFNMFSVSWPEGLVKIISGVKSLKLDVIQIPNLSCLWNGISFRGTLMTYTIGPLAAFGALLMPAVISFCLGQRNSDPKRWRMTLDGFWTNTMFLFFILYPAISVAVINSFNCDVQLGLLKTDYRELCPSLGSYVGIYSLFFFFLYPVGIPVLIILVLKREGIQKIVLERLKLAEFDAMIALYIRVSCSTESQRFARQVGEAGDDLDEFSRQADMVFDVLLSKQGLPDQTVLVIDELENSAINMGLEGTSMHDICVFLRSFDSDGDGNVDRDEFKIMLQTARAAANVFTGNEKAELVTDRQLNALLLYEWPSKEASVSDIDSEGGLGGFIAQMHKEQSILMADTKVQEEKTQQDREDRRSQIEAGNRSDPLLVTLDEIAQELRELQKQTGRLDHYHDWAIDLIEAENRYIENPDALELCIARIRVKQLTYEQKQERVAELAHTLCQKGVTAVPPQIWNEILKNSDDLPSDEEKIVRRLGFVFKAYRVEYWWWETTEMLRKFLMTSLLIFVYPDDPAQMAAGAMITFIFLLLNMTFQPFCTTSLNSLQSFSMVAQFLTLFAGILLAMTEKQEQEVAAATPSSRTDRSIVSFLIILINCTTLVFPVVRLVFNGGLVDYYEQVHFFVGCMNKWICCGMFGRKVQKHETLSLQSRLARLDVSKVGEDECSSSEQSATTSPIIHHVASLHWWGIQTDMHKKTSHQAMPVLVQKARAFYTWRQVALFPLQSPLLSPATLPSTLTVFELHQEPAQNNKKDQHPSTNSQILQATKSPNGNGFKPHGLHSQGFNPNGMKSNAFSEPARLGVTPTNLASPISPASAQGTRNAEFTVRPSLGSSFNQVLPPPIPPANRLSDVSLRVSLTSDLVTGQHFLPSIPSGLVDPEQSYNSLATNSTTPVEESSAPWQYPLAEMSEGTWRHYDDRLAHTQH